MVSRHAAGHFHTWHVALECAGSAMEPGSTTVTGALFRFLAARQHGDGQGTVLGRRTNRRHSIRADMTAESQFPGEEQKPDPPVSSFAGGELSGGRRHRRTGGDACGREREGTCRTPRNGQQAPHDFRYARDVDLRYGLSSRCQFPLRVQAAGRRRLGEGRRRLGPPCGPPSPLRRPSPRSRPGARPRRRHRRRRGSRPLAERATEVRSARPGTPFSIRTPPGSQCAGPGRPPAPC